MVIFRLYVNLPEGICFHFSWLVQFSPLRWFQACAALEKLTFDDAKRQAWHAARFASNGKYPN
jgi:hypothetical protein